MKEVDLPPSPQEILTASFLACLATVLEMPLDRLPRLPADADPATGWAVSRWLGGLSLAIARVAEPGAFSWPGPWLARIRPPAGGQNRDVVMYGVPSGLAFDPGGDAAISSDWIEDGFIIAAADVALALPARPGAPAAGGTVEGIWIAEAAGTPAQGLPAVQALAGRGLTGDRHVTGTGTFPSGLPGSALTLIEAEVCESFDPPLRPYEHRRNLITRGIDLNALVGHDFMIGNVRCRGMRLCEPCKVADRYAARPILRAHPPRRAPRRHPLRRTDPHRRPHPHRRPPTPPITPPAGAAQREGVVTSSVDQHNRGRASLVDHIAEEHDCTTAGGRARNQEPSLAA